MGVYFLRPPVTDLVFQLYGRHLHPELFDILAVRKIQRDDYELTVRITRTGHVITWENADVLFDRGRGRRRPGASPAAPSASLPAARRVQRQAALRHGIHYQMSFQVETLPPEIFLQVQDELRADGDKRGLIHTFPAQHRIDVAPLGFVTADGRPGCLCLSTFHTFPLEHTIVKTQSLIEKHGGRPA